MAFDGALHITDSLELAAANAGDVTAAVYARLSARAPETQALFVLDRDGQVRGAMLAHVFETIMDFIGDRRYAHRFIAAEIVTHDAYGVSSDVFVSFFGIVRDEVREACGQSWSPAMDGAWRQLLAETEAHVANPA